jgi:hypothetical protein
MREKEEVMAAIDFEHLKWDANDEFLHFAFGGFNTKNYCQNQTTLFRVSDGDRYNMDLAPQLNDKTAQISGRDGQYFFNTEHKAKVFDVSIAFDGLTKD